MLVTPSVYGTVAEFTDGNGTTTSDQFAGVAGNGWATAWGTTGLNGTVVSTTPLLNSGNYLQLTNQAVTSTYLRRQYQNFDGLDIAQPYRISLSYRLDAPNLTNFTDFNDRIAIFGDTTAQTASGATNTWLIGVAGSNTSAGAGQSVFPGEWYFFDNNGTNAFATSNMFDTNLALVAGRTYAITVDVNPQLGTYSAAINDGVNPTVSASNLTFRRGAGVAAGSFLHFSHNSSLSSDNTSYSVDSIQIVPEPAAAVALIAGIATLSSLRRRRA